METECDKEKFVKITSKETVVKREPGLSLGTFGRISEFRQLENKITIGNIWRTDRGIAKKHIYGFRQAFVEGHQSVVIAIWPNKICLSTVSFIVLI